MVPDVFQIIVKEKGVFTNVTRCANYRSSDPAVEAAGSAAACAGLRQ